MDEKRKCEFEQCKKECEKFPDFVMMPLAERYVYLCRNHAENVFVQFDGYDYRLQLIEKHDWMSWWCHKLTTEQRTDAIKKLYADQQGAKNAPLDPVMLGAKIAGKALFDYKKGLTEFEKKQYERLAEITKEYEEKHGTTPRQDLQRLADSGVVLTDQGLPVSESGAGPVTLPVYDWKEYSAKVSGCLECGETWATNPDFKHECQPEKQAGYKYGGML